MSLRPVGGVSPGRPAVASQVQKLLLAARNFEKAGRHGEALLRYRDALQTAGDDRGSFAGVIDALAQACRARPKDAQLRHMLGRAQLFARQVREAALTLAKAATLAPADAATRQALGESLMQSGDAAGALAAFRKAVALAPDNPQMRLQLAGTLAFKGERAEALGIYRALVDEGSRDPLALAGLIEVSDYAGRDDEPPEYAAATALADTAALPPALRRMLHFAAAKIDRARKRREAEFGHYMRAKSSYPEAFDIGYFRELLQALKSVTNAEFFAARRDFGDASERPIFIFGMPRSGTTLTEQILGSHPAVAAAGELGFFAATMQRLGLGMRRRLDTPLERVAERVRGLDRAEARAIASQYNSELQWRGGGKRRVTDKMPQNFLRLWLIALLYPGATYIHCTRDPVATCFSCYTEDLGDAHAYTADFATLAAYFHEYEALMRHWASVLPVAIRENRYETLVAEAEPATRRLLAAARLDFDPATLAFHESDRVARTASYAQVRQPIHQGSVEKWRAYGPLVEPLVAALNANPGPKRELPSGS